ncbi:MAG: eutQ 1 [Proteobacteria bacterium]|nr:eutQ 1 [Pseudomonadota bacterium]
MKTLISAETVRQAKAGGQTCLAAGKDVLVTPEARSLADELGVRLDDSADAPTLIKAAGATEDPAMASIRAAVLAKLPADAANKPELVDQIVSKVCLAQKNAAAKPQVVATASATKTAAAAGIKLVKGADVHLGVFPGAGTDKQVGIADVITAADGAPIAAGFMAWSQCFFPWTLDYDEIDLVLEGELHIRHNGQTYVGKSGDVLYIPKGSAIEFGTTTAVRFFYVTYPANWQG